MGASDERDLLTYDERVEAAEARVDGLAREVARLTELVEALTGAKQVRRAA